MSHGHCWRPVDLGRFYTLICEEPVYGWAEVLKAWSVQTAAQEVLAPNERAGLPDTSMLESVSIPDETDFFGQWSKLRKLDEKSQTQWVTAAYDQLSTCRLPDAVSAGVR